MMNETDISHLVRKLAEALGVEETTAARLATGSGDTLARIDGGMSPTMRRGRQIIQRVSDLWPDDLPWPDGIDRPSPKKAA